MELNSLNPHFHYGWCRGEALAVESELEDNPSPILYNSLQAQNYSLKEDWDWKDFHLYSYSPQCPRSLIRTTNLSTPYGQCQRLNSIFFNQPKEKEKNPTGFDIEHSLKCIRSTQAQRIFSKNLEFGVSEEVQGKNPFWSNLRKLHYCNLRW